MKKFKFILPLLAMLLVLTAGYGQVPSTTATMTINACSFYPDQVVYISVTWEKGATSTIMRDQIVPFIVVDIFGQVGGSANINIPADFDSMTIRARTDQSNKIIKRTYYKKPVQDIFDFTVIK